MSRVEKIIKVLSEHERLLGASEFIELAGKNCLISKDILLLQLGTRLMCAIIGSPVGRT